jgi:hypothetical protein
LRPPARAHHSEDAGEADAARGRHRLKLTTLRPEHYPEFYRFNQESFPSRVSVPARFRFQILDNPLLANQDAPDVVVVSDDAGLIVGQVILQPVDFHYNGIRARGYMGVDLFVKESARNARAGAAIAFKIVRSYSPFLSVATSAAADKMFAAIGIRTVGTMRKFLWVCGVRGLVGRLAVIAGERDRTAGRERVADRGELHRRAELRFIDDDVVIEIVPHLLPQTAVSEHPHRAEEVLYAAGLMRADQQFSKIVVAQDIAECDQ